MGWWQDPFRKRAEDWTFHRMERQQLPVSDQRDSEPVAPEAGYLDIFLRSMRIVNVRRGLAKFSGTVSSFISLPHLSGEKAQFSVVTTPAKLKELDAANIDRVISMNQRLLGPVPYRGGDLEIELGLLSIKSSDLAAPYLSVLEGMSKAAGVSYITAAIPFVRQIADGINLLAGAQGEQVLEVGYATVIQQPMTGYYLVMRAPKGSVTTEDLRIDQDFRLIAKGGRPVAQYPYMLFSVAVSPKRDDWFRIPEVVAAYKDLNAQVRVGKREATMDALGMFRRTALTCLDLLLADAERLVKKVTLETNQVMGTAPTSFAPRELPLLAQLDIYTN